jgi:hypothetical protein
VDHKIVNVPRLAIVRDIGTAMATKSAINDAPRCVESLMTEVSRRDGNGRALHTPLLNVFSAA